MSPINLLTSHTHFCMIPVTLTSIALPFLSPAAAHKSLYTLILQIHCTLSSHNYIPFRAAFRKVAKSVHIPSGGLTGPLTRRHWTLR